MLEMYVMKQEAQKKTLDPQKEEKKKKQRSIHKGYVDKDRLMFMQI